MKIGVLSDTHGNRKAIDRILREHPDTGLWLHAGDYTRDGEYLRQSSKAPVKLIAGNNDVYFGNKHPESEFFEVAGKNIWMTHGHRQHVKWGVKTLLDEGRDYGADIIIFGHTHEPLVEKHGEILLLNPGAATTWGGSYAVLNIDGGTITADIIEL